MLLWSLAAVALLLAACGVLAAQALSVRSDLQEAAALAPRLQDQVAEQSIPEAESTLARLQERAGSARAAASGPLWDAASALPVVGPSLRAASAAALAVDSLAQEALPSLLEVAATVDPAKIMPGQKAKDLAPLKAAEPLVARAAAAARGAEERLAAVDTDALLPQLREPLVSARAEVVRLREALDVGEDAVRIAPGLLGADGARTYLVLVQNNAESRATGGIPGALVEMTVEDGALSLGRQGSASGLGSFMPRIEVDPTQQRIYSTRLGRYMQDVNLTPDFPTSARTAAAMWERSGGRRVDGVVSVDPVGLARLLAVMGPVELDGEEFAPFRAAGLPTTLTAQNAVKALLSDVYRVEDTRVQDLYFAAVARQIFGAFSSSSSSATAQPEALVRALGGMVEEGRLLVFSAHEEEQAVIAGWDAGGSVSRTAGSEVRFGAYFNDGTGAKMDYYMRRTARLEQKCTPDGSQIVMHVTLKNAAPADAGRTLPDYVTGRGVFGVPPGTVQTNVVAYGPRGAGVESVRVNGRSSGLSADVHAGRPLATTAVRVAPGQTVAVEVAFSQLPPGALRLDLTPGVQPRSEAVGLTTGALCTEGR
ncbi:DUF4012 domain-containing protein [Sinomonas halotolerans]|uniref:DUF4012 domain-containing protein n=1 Tax=Sinomonas halotolerans TaxID=1644133 RepID=A0ABU9WXX9_9MICC